MILGGRGHVTIMYCLVFYIELGFNVNVVITFYLESYCLCAVHGA